MSRPNQYGSYYDPVGSQANQPSGYRYQNTTTSASAYPSSATSASYQNAPNYQNYGSSNYNNQQYTAGGQTGGSSTNRAAAALSSLSGQEYNQPASTTQASSSNQYDNSGYSNYGSSSYTGSNLQPPNRSQANNSPLYTDANTNQSSATFGRLSYAPTADQPQSTAQNYGTQNTSQTLQNTGSTSATSDRSYKTAYTQPAQTQQQHQPQRYASPLHAVQAQQQQRGHTQQASRTSNQTASPQITARQTAHQSSNRQQSASVEPTAMTVDPSQVYDYRAEQEKKARIEAERRRKVEEAEAARKAEEDRIAEEKRKVEEAERKEKEAAAKKEAEKERRKKAREEKKQSKNAATALTKMASTGGDPNAGYDGPPANDEEAEMRAMFKKMREFNSKNPAMLAKLWEEERRSHSSPSQPPQPKPASPVQAKKPGPPPKQAGVGASTPNGLNATPQTVPPSMKPFKKPDPTAKTPAQPSPQQPQAGPSSLWPPGKKGFLAEAAAKWLSSQTPGKAISKGQVLERLDSNPTYVQLCESLEAFGLKFERAAFARELLRAVPENQKTQSTPSQPSAPSSAVNDTASQVNGPPKPSGDGTPTKKKKGRPTKAEMDARNSVALATQAKQEASNADNGMVNYETPAFQSLAQAAAEVNNMHRPSATPMGMGGPVQPPAYQSPFAPPLQHQNMANGNMAPSQSQPQEIKPEFKPSPPPRPPANKEEAARKRTFGDLVDLTKDDDSDDELPPRKMPVLHTNSWQEQRPPSVGQYHTPVPKAPGMSHLVQYQGPKPGQSLQGMRPGAPPPALMTSIAPNAPPAAFIDPSLKSSETPKPVQAPAPAPPPPKPKGPNQERLQEERLRGRMLVEPIMRDRVARKSRYDSRTIARDVLLATGRHPDMRPLNAHMYDMHKLLANHGGVIEGGGNRSDLATIRWDIIDPELKVKPATTAGGIAVEAEDADDEGDLPAATVVRQQAIDNGDGTMHFVSVHEQISGKPKKKRGRPSKFDVAKFALTSGTGERREFDLASRDAETRRASSGGAAQHTPSQPARRTPISAPAARTEAPNAPAGTPVGYSQFKKYDEHGNEIKRKGRPVGWRKDVHSRAAQGLAPATSASSSSLPGRPRKSQAAEDMLQQPQYQVYKCLWRDCKAELHNLETLKKHVVKVHGKSNDNGVYECLWQGCSSGDEHPGSAKAKAREATFPDIMEWLKHVEKEHLQSIAWKLGDGPKGGMSDHRETDSEAYLSDAQGRSVTPIITPRVPTEATSQVMPNVVRGPGRPKKDGLSGDERDAAGELQKLEDQMRSTGPSMVRTGSRLANKKRRLGFLDDEDFEGHIESDDVPEPDD